MISRAFHGSLPLCSDTWRHRSLFKYLGDQDILLVAEHVLEHNLLDHIGKTLEMIRHTESSMREEVDFVVVHEGEYRNGHLREQSTESGLHFGVNTYLCG